MRSAITPPRKPAVLSCAVSVTDLSHRSASQRSMRHRSHSYSVDVLSRRNDSRLLSLSVRDDLEGEDSAAAVLMGISMEGEGEAGPSSGVPFHYARETGLDDAEAAELLKHFGRNELPEKVVPKWYIFVSQLWQPMPVMIWIAACVEAAILNWVDMSILLAIQMTNASIGYYEVSRRRCGVSCAAVMCHEPTDYESRGCRSGLKEVSQARGHSEA